MSFIKTALATAALVLAGTSHAGNLVTNGTFAGDAGSYTTESGSFADWTVTRGTVDWIGTYWSAPGGTNSIDLDGNSPGTLTQSLALGTGQYAVTFDLAGNPDAGRLKLVKVSLGDAPAQLLIFRTPRDGSMGWVSETLLFNVTGGSDLVFASADSYGAYGAALANVSVTAVPEASSTAMLLAGIGLMGVVAVRRRTA